LFVIRRNPNASEGFTGQSPLVLQFASHSKLE
jgi:hypothetical protein